MAIPFLLAGLGATAAREAQKWLDERRRLLEKTAEEIQFYQENKERLRATSCGPDKLWIQERDPDVKTFQYDVQYPRAQSVDGPPGGERFWGYCIPDPAAERLKDDQRVENSLRGSMIARAKSDLGHIDSAFANFVAQGRSPEEARAELFAPNGIATLLKTYLDRYAAEGLAVPLDVPSLIARNSDRIRALRTQMGTTPPETSPVSPPPSIGSTATALSRTFNSQLFLATVLTSPFWIPVLALPAIRKWRGARGRRSKRSR